MFLFKNIKNLICRIGLNMAVYGFVLMYLFVFLAIALPNIKAYLFYGICLCLAVCIAGVLIFLWFLLLKRPLRRLTNIGAYYFKKNMNPYINAGLVRVVARNRHFAVISIGERVYAVCPYELCYSWSAAGLRIIETADIKDFVKKPKDIYPFMSALFNNLEKCKSVLCCFSEADIDTWKKWTNDNGHINFMDSDFENWLTLYTSNKRIFKDR